MHAGMTRASVLAGGAVRVAMVTPVAWIGRA
jgi:hypothetical protein